MHRIFRAVIIVVGGALASFINPIAWPGWLVEWIVRRVRPGWAFDQYSATPYFLAISLVATKAIVSGGTLGNWLGVYLLSAMELLALWICVTVSIGRPGLYFGLLRRFGRRSRRVTPNRPLFGVPTLYMGVVSYGFTIYCFGLLYFVVNRLDGQAFSGVARLTSLQSVWQFWYFSAVTITTLGYGDIAPRTFTSQLLAVIEVLLGLFFVLFLFGAFVSFHVGRISKDL
jgi:hypothetical protein